MLKNLPNPDCCKTDDVRYLCDRCAAAVNARLQGHDPEDDLFMNEEFEDDDLLLFNEEEDDFDLADELDPDDEEPMILPILNFAADRPYLDKLTGNAARRGRGKESKDRKSSSPRKPVTNAIGLEEDDDDILIPPKMRY